MNTRNTMSPTTRRRWARVTLGALLTAVLAVGGFGVIDAVAKPAKPTTSLPSGSTDTIRVQWKNTNRAVVRYKVRYSKSSSMSGASTTGCLPVRKDAGEWTSYQWVQGLTAGTTYYFQVAGFTDTACKKQDGAWSSRSDGRRTAKAGYGAPGTPVATNRASTSLELHFVNVSGAGGYRIRYSSKYGTQYIWSQVEDLTLTGLRKNTEYKIKVAVAERESRAGSPTDCALYSSINCWPSYQQGPYSKEIKVKTSSYSIAAPGNVTISNQQAYQVTVNWKAPRTLSADYQYRIQYAKNQKMTGAKSVTNRGNDTSHTITKLSSNTNYYVRVYVVRKNSSGKWVTASDKSAFQIAKTRTPFGTIAGTVQGLPGSGFNPRDVQAMVYSTSGELVDQVDVGSDGRYSAQVRPGRYRVKLTYTGAGSFASSWVTTKSRYGLPLAGWGTAYSVSRSSTRTASTTTLLPAASLDLTVKTSGGALISGADVAVINAHTKSREVDSVQRTVGGKVTLRGLTVPASFGASTPGKYWIRVVAGGKKTVSVWVKLKRSSATALPRITEWGIGSGSGRAYNGVGMTITMKNK